MEDTATPETGPVDAPAMDSAIAQFLEDAPPEPETTAEAVAQEMVNEAESTDGEPSQEEPAAEEDATDPEVETEEAPEGDPATDEQLVTVKVNGEERQVPLSEAIAGYSRLGDYKVKTAEVAEQRRELEAKATTIEADVKAHFANQLEEATKLFAESDPVLQEAGKIDWEYLKATDPAAYLQASDAVKARWDLFDQATQKIATARQESQQHQAQMAEQERTARFDTAANKIVEAMPELADQAKFEAFASQAVELLRSEGFTAAEIADTLDDRVLRLADDARQWRAHKAAQQSLPEKKVVPRSAVKPLTTDNSSSRATPNRPPSGATRDRKVGWVVDQLLSQG